MKKLPLKLLLSNDGQIEGLPANPRSIRDVKFEKLKRSIQEDPEMLELRELLVFPHGKQYVIIAGNMRFEAAKSLGIEELPVKILPADMPVEKLRSITIKDNNSFGDWDWDSLANEWDVDSLDEWGLDLPPMAPLEEPGEREADKARLSETAEKYVEGTIRQIVLYFSPEQHAEVLSDLQAIGQTYGIEDDNTEVFLKLLEYYKEHNELPS